MTEVERLHYEVEWLREEALSMLPHEEIAHCIEEADRFMNPFGETDRHSLAVARSYLAAAFHKDIQELLWRWSENEEFEEIDPPPEIRRAMRKRPPARPAWDPTRVGVDPDEVQQIAKGD